MRIFIFKTNEWGYWMWLAVRSRFKKSAERRLLQLTQPYTKPVRNWIVEVHKEKDIKDFFKVLQLETLYEAKTNNLIEVVH